MKVAIIGAFGKGKDLLNGQTIKTKIIADELEKKLGKGIWRIDTIGNFNNLLSLALTIVALIFARNVIILPAQKALKVLAPWVRFWNHLFHRKLHYIVIGGWLPEYVDKHSCTREALGLFDCIYVETQIMKDAMCERGFNNIVVLPNCKDLDIIGLNELVQTHSEPLRLATFSRVMKEKGIEIAIEAVSQANKKIGTNVFCLDIYGQIESSQKIWFESLKETFPQFVTYRGLVPFDRTTRVLKNYFLLLFPTYYEGEGFAGTIIDAFAAGVPVIASDWRYNSEIIKDGVTGKIVSVGDVIALSDVLIWFYANKEKRNEIANNCLAESKYYLPHNVISIVTNQLEIN